MAELGEFARHHEEFTTLGVQILGISTDPLEKAREVSAQVKTPFPILSDHKGEAMMAFGTRNPESEEPLNVPTLVLIDGAGIVRWIHQAEDYKVRAPVGAVLKEAKKLAKGN
jgi:peroxiredoxin